MKRNYYLPIAALLPALLLAACSLSPATGSRIRGKVADPAYEGRQVWLRDTRTGAAVDSTSVSHRSFSFALADSLPQVYLLVLKASDDDLFPATLPVVSEQGDVSVLLGESVFTGGTPLNDQLQDFLLAVDRLSEESSRQGKDVEQVRADFGSLLEASILRNIDNAVGVYLFRSYESHFTAEQKASILSRGGDRFGEPFN